MSGIVAIVGIAGLSAIAGGALKEKSAAATIANFETGSATAKCKKANEAVSGGFAIPDFDVNYSEASIYEIGSARGGKRKWTVSGVNYGLAAGELVAFAYCDKSEARLKAKSQNVTVPAPDGVESATAKCKKGSEAVAGGVEVSDYDPNVIGSAINVIESRRAGKRKWTVSGANDGAAAGELVAVAYCDESEPGLKTKSRTLALGPYPDIRSATPKCKKGSEAVSGGFETSDFDPSANDGPRILPLASFREGKRKWAATGYNDSPAAGGEFIGYAYCEKK